MKSRYSLRYGTIDVDQIPAEAKKLGYDAVALTDTGNSTGVFDFFRAAAVHGIKAIVGMEFREGPVHLYTALACNEEGFREINELQSRSNVEGVKLPVRAPDFRHTFVIYPLSNLPERLRVNEFCGVRISQLTRLYNRDSHFLQRCVLFHTVTFSAPPDFMLHKVLRAIDNNLLLSRLPENECADAGEYWLSPDKLREACAQYPDLLKNNILIADACDFVFDFKSSKNRRTYTGKKYDDLRLLEKLAMEGLIRRYGEGHEEAERRVRKELAVIESLDFTAFFLIAWDIVSYSQHRGFYHVGRGSGANSVVSYCLGITDVCPIELDLYFERFLNPSRFSPPDFDIDWSWKTRDEILTYIFRRFGKEHTAFMGAIGTFRYRSHIRELGKVFGLPKKEIDQMTDHNFPSVQQNSVTEKVLHFSQLLEGFPNLRTLHACGILITEKPLTCFTALDMPPKGFQTVQFDMYMGEDAGFEKLDILSQRGIGHINECERLILENRGEKADVHNHRGIIRDPLINDKLSRGDTLGCFYIESPAMRGLLRRLRCGDYITLVAASSIIRPGVAQSGMMREYIRRHNGEEFAYFHDVFREQLGETYGIMVYQEDVIKIAHHFAGLSLAEADVLRRVMSGKGRTRPELEILRNRFFSNCREKGYPDELAEEVYRQISSFAGYSFCKAHSASYSVESYQSLYLKTYYPMEFAVAVINNFGGFYRTEIYIHEARRTGATIHLPCVNHSRLETTIANGAIYLGMQHLHGFPAEMAQKITSEREKNGSFLSLEDFTRRVNIGNEVMRLLIFSGAFRFTGMQKGELALRARLMTGHVVPQEAPQFFPVPARDFKLPEITRSVYEDAFDELELLGFTVSCQPFDLLKTKFRGEVTANTLSAHEGKLVRMVAYLVATKDVPTNRGRMFFGTWIDVEGNYFDTTHFPQVAADFPFTGGGCYLLEGRVTIDFDFPMLEVTRMARLPIVDDPRFGNEKGERVTSFPATFDVNPVFLTRAPYPSAREVKEKFGGK